MVAFLLGEPPLQLQALVAVGSQEEGERCYHALSLLLLGLDSAGVQLGTGLPSKRVSEVEAQNGGVGGAQADRPELQ